MAFLKFNKSELVNLSYSLKREILCSNKTGAYANTSILGCNTRRYHGLLAVTLDRFGGDRYLLLSCLDESLVINGKQFNLGIHRYGGIYEPRGHKYIVDFQADPVPQLTYKVGEVVLRKSLVLPRESDQVLVRYELISAPAPVKLVIWPFLAFRNIHDLTHQNPSANPNGSPIPGGRSYQLYPGFPKLNLQLSDPSAVISDSPAWNMGITYSDEARRGFECKEDLVVPGSATISLSEGSSLVLSASIYLQDATDLQSSWQREYSQAKEISGYRDQLRRCADSLITHHNGVSLINSGFSWLKSGLLRETLLALPGLTLHGLKDKKLFEEILDNLISAESERLFHKTTQVEAPLILAYALQQYLEFGARPTSLWRKYGPVMKSILQSYLPGVREEISMHPNGLLWAQKDSVALSWMNAYVGGQPVTERAGYQVETNSYWYNAIRFCLQMEGKSKSKDAAFISKWSEIEALVRANFQPTFWSERYSCLADYVDNSGQHTEIRPNQLCAIACPFSALDDNCYLPILRLIDRELVTSRGIRTLSPRDDKYKSVYEGSQTERDLAYHQGCTRPSLLEPYILTSLRLHGESFLKKAEWLVEGFYDDLAKHGVGAFSELYDGDPPHEPHGAISSALSTAALLTIEYALDKFKEGKQ